MGREEKMKKVKDGERVPITDSSPQDHRELRERTGERCGKEKVFKLHVKIIAVENVDISFL